MARKPSDAQLGLFGPEELGPEIETTPDPLEGIAAASVPPQVVDLAGRIPEGIRLGTSSWSFPGWAGIVYEEAWSQGVLARRGLEAYSKHPLLRTVGIDRTYYAPISAEDFAHYAAAVPEGFRFLVKAHDACTMARFPKRERYGDRRGQRNDRFLDAQYATDRVVAPMVEGLGAKAGPLVFQFPPQRLRDLGGAKGFAEAIQRFLSELPKGLHYAVEIRNEGLLTRTYAEALEDVGAAHCINVHPRMPHPELQWLTAGLKTGSRGLVVRWMLPTNLSYEKARNAFAPFNRLVQEDEPARKALADLTVGAQKAGREVTIVINNKAEGSAPLSVARLAEAIDIRLRS